MYTSIKGFFEKIGKILPDKLYLRLMFRYHLRERLNLDRPKSYSEKLQWLKINDRRPEQLEYVDKYNVREYIKSTIGDKYLIPLIGVYENVEEIDWSKLPEKFVIKCTHGSGSNIICTDKKLLDINECKKNLRKWMSQNWYWYGREWSYRDLKPKIICEKYLDDNIVDYKFMCFHGEPKLIQVHQERYNSNHTIDFYDINWKKTEIARKNTPKSNNILPKPINLEEMLNLSRKLSKDEIHVRVDFYEVNGNVYFGEKTYYSASGFSPFAEKKHDELLGSWIKLPG